MSGEAARAVSHRRPGSVDDLVARYTDSELVLRFHGEAPALDWPGARAAGETVRLPTAQPALLMLFFMTGLATESVFREHGLNTWQRLRISPLRDMELLAGKVAPGLVLVVAQRSVLFGLGWVVMGPEVRGNPLALLVVMVSLAVCVVAFALVPTELMAQWVGWVARATPVYWAGRGFREAILNGGGVAAVLPYAGALCAFAVLFTALAAWRFKGEAVKQDWD